MKPYLVALATLDGAVLLGFIGSLTYDQVVPYTCTPASPPPVPGSHPMLVPCISPASLGAFLLLTLLIPLLIITFVLLAVDHQRRQRSS